MSKYRFFLTAIISSTMIAVSSSTACSQEDDNDPIAQAYKETERLSDLLKLDDLQKFYVDSVLQTNITGMFDDFERMKNSGYISRNTYKAISDKWAQKTYEAFRLILTEEQYYTYMVSSGKGKDLKEKKKAEEKARKKAEKEEKRKKAKK